MKREYDAVVVGSGPNGLAAAITLAEAGLAVLVVEVMERPGGGLRSGELTLPGFYHDACAAVLPLAVASPFFRRLPLERHGLEWVEPPLPAAHPLDGGRAVAVHRSLEETAEALGIDGNSYAKLFGHLVQRSAPLLEELLAPLVRFPRRPALLARFGLPALLPASVLARLRFRTEGGKALFAGMAAHSVLPLEAFGSAAFGLVLTLLAHVAGWPFVKGGTANLAAALCSYFTSLGGEIATGWKVETLDELPKARAYFFDTAPRDLARIAGTRLPERYRARLLRFRHGPGVCKVDYALDAPVPWLAGVCRHAGTVHLGGSLKEIAASERSAWQGRHAERPFVIVAQPSLFDPERAPEGTHVLWAYAHVPHGSGTDVAERIEAQIERFAPGFRKHILARCVRTAAQLEAYNPNYPGGDINCGVQDLRQMFVRPVLSPAPYATPDPTIYLCSSATPPGGGVHGMCGYHAARAALTRLGLG